MITITQQLLLATSILVATSITTAQNSMVLDANLNDTKCVENGFGKITSTINWKNGNGGTVDLFTGNNSKFSNGMPLNYMGSQNSLGGNYAGLIAFKEDGINNHTKGEVYGRNHLSYTDGYKDYTEYLKGELTQPLEAGKVYRVSFKVSLSEKSARAVSCMGALFTNERDATNNTKVNCDNKLNCYNYEKPQIISHRIISDSTNWITISGNYTAKGGEKSITVGCFPDENFKIKNLVGRSDLDSRRAYYYVCNVSVTPYNAKPIMDDIVNGVEFVELTNLQFETNKSDIETKFYDELDELASWIKSHPQYKFYMVGYTDIQGNDAINDPLSLERAKSVKKYLLQKGVDNNNILIDGFGSKNPLENNTKSRTNRRVEIYLLDLQTSQVK